MVPADRVPTEKPVNLPWALAMLVGLAAAATLAVLAGTPTATRQLLRGVAPADDPVVHRDTWCPTPEQRAGVAVVEPIHLGPPEAAEDGAIPPPATRAVEPGLTPEADEVLAAERRGAALGPVAAALHRRIIGRLVRIRRLMGEAAPYPRRDPAEAPVAARAELDLLIAELRELGGEVEP